MPEKCEHKKWSKWKQSSSSLGQLVQTKSCKKCGWTETKLTEFFQRDIFKKAIKATVNEILDEREKEKKVKE